MNRKLMRMLILAAITVTVLGISNESFAQGSTPEGLVKTLYKIHAADWKTDNDTILNAKSRKILGNYFDKTLADLIWKDINAKGNEVGALEFDPFYEGQDALIKKLVVGKSKISGNEATVIVTFLNFKEKKKLTYKLSKSAAGWRISDILYSDGSRLLKIFQDAS
jgi:Protein of unknown function (DUF3828)